MSKEEELNEDCGCGSTSDNIRSYTDNVQSKYATDPMVGKKVVLVDGRTGLVDDSVRNNFGEVIGYVIEGDRGNFRVFKNKIQSTIDESGEAMATLASTPGMGDVVPPGPGRTGSGDKFPSIGFNAKPAKKKKKEKKDKDPLDTSVMDYNTFLSKGKHLQ